MDRIGPRIPTAWAVLIGAALAGAGPAAAQRAPTAQEIAGYSGLFAAAHASIVPLLSPPTVSWHTPVFR